MTKISIPSSLVTIATTAFSGCVSMEKVYYEGDTAETWPPFDEP